MSAHPDRVPDALLINYRCNRIVTERMVLVTVLIEEVPYKETARKEEIFYEVDLKDLAEANDPVAFLYFYAFFRRAAFEPPLGDRLTLDGMLRESVDYARGVSESLKLQVFDALRHLAQGFLDYPHNRLEPTPETLPPIILAIDVAMITWLLGVGIGRWQERYLPRIARRRAEWRRWTLLGWSVACGMQLFTIAVTPDPIFGLWLGLFVSSSIHDIGAGLMVARFMREAELAKELQQEHRLIWYNV